MVGFDALDGHALCFISAVVRSETKDALAQAFIS